MNPGILRADRDTVSIWSSLRAPIANRTISFLGSSGSASTPMENIAIIELFEEIRVLIRKKHVNLAGSGWSLFLPRILVVGGCERQPDARYCPPKRSRRRNWGMGGLFRFFLNLAENSPIFMSNVCDRRSHRCFIKDSVFVDVRVRIRLENLFNNFHAPSRWLMNSKVFSKFFRKFFSCKKYFPDFYR